MSWRLYAQRGIICLYNFARIRAGPVASVRAFRLAQQARRAGAMQKAAELAPLLALLCRRKPSCVLEIGTAKGGTLFAFAAVAAPDAVILSVDLPGGRFGGGYDESELPRLKSYLRAEQTLHAFRADSHDQATLTAVKAALGGRLVDLLFIDGDHTYEGALADFGSYSPLVDPEAGIIVLHDILPSGRPDCHVDRLWRVLVSAHRCELVDRTEDDGWWVRRWGGIGVIYPPFPAAPALVSRPGAAASAAKSLPSRMRTEPF